MKKQILFSLLIVIFVNLNAQVTETVIGTTTYDLQTNYSVQNRILNHGNGTMSAVWTYSQSGDLAATDRGTGYNYFNGTSWGAAPTARIETEKTGWPNLGTTSGGDEIFICHNTASQVITMGKRASIGSGTWTVSNITSAYDVWDRITIGGANGQTIHRVACRAGAAFGGAPVQGVEWALLYSRSLDAGATWGIQEIVIPGLDSTRFATLSGDSYAIDSKGDTVVVVYFGNLIDVVMAKSIDNGSTWSITAIIDQPFRYDPNSSATTGSIIGISDANGDGTADTIKSSDGSGTVVLDNNGVAHVFFGEMWYLDDTPGDGVWSYFPGISNLMYWNENFGNNPPEIITGALDLDGNGQLDIIGADPNTGVGTYFMSLASMPSAGIDANNNIYLSYSAIREDLSNSIQNYRHIYAMTSSDDGCSWSTPVDITDDGIGTNDFNECVFGSMANMVDANMDILYQRDVEPGLAVRGDMDAFGTNEIVHLEAPISVLNLTPFTCITYVNGDTTFCIGDSVLLTASCGTVYNWSTGASTQNIYATTYGTFTVTITTPCGAIVDGIITSSSSSPPSVSVNASQVTACNGDTTTIWANNVPGATYLWSTGATTDTITVTSTGTYTVTVTNCAGNSTNSITINLPGAPVASISGNSIFCTGDSTLLTAGAVTGATYSWSTGATTQSIYVSATGTYTVTVTNCGGTDNTSITVSTEPVPSPIITPSGPTAICEGSGSITLLASGGNTYLWSNGSTVPFITLSSVSESGSYTVTAYNLCGDSTVSSSITVAINSAPPPPVISATPITCNGASDGTLASNAASGNQWYMDSLTLVGETGQTYIGAGPGNYYTIVTDSNGCPSPPSSSIALSDPPVLLVSTSSVAPSCGASDGSATVVATGGNSPYSYLWDDTNNQTTVTATGLASATYNVTVTDASNCVVTTSVAVLNSTIISLSTTIVDPTCGNSDGAASVTASGGATPYSYQWDDVSSQTSSIAINLPAGTYTVTVTDANGCTSDTTVNLSNPGAPTVTFTSTDVSCNGGNDGVAIANPSGGISPYSYQWSTGDSVQIVSLLTSGTYIVTVTDANNCAATASVIISEPAAPVLTTTTVDPTCGNNDGQASISVTGTNSPYTYQWDDASAQTSSIAVNLAAGTYTVSVTDASNCTFTTTVNLANIGAPTVSLTTNDVTCNNGSDGVAVATSSGGTSPYTYSWSGGQTAQIISGLTAGNYSVTVADVNSCTATAAFTINEPVGASLSVSSTNPSCGNSDGTAIVTVSGTNSPYTYLWNNGETAANATGLAAGTYSVTVTDASNCAVDTSVSLTDAGAGILAVTSINISCFGAGDGVASVTVSGGTSPYTYQWSSGGTSAIESGLMVGTYFVTVTDSAGCVSTGSATITEPSGIAITMTTADPSCGNSDGAINAAVSGGSSPYTYQWDDPNTQTTAAATGLAAGTYTVTVTDASGCISTASVNLSNPNAPLLFITSADATCNGSTDGLASVSVTGGVSPFTYLWSSGATVAIVTNLGVGTYSITVTDANSCIAIASAIINGPPPFSVLSTITNDMGSCDGSANLSVSGGTPSYSFSWDNGQADSTATGLCAGNYSVTITDVNGCDTTVTVTVPDSTGVGINEFIAENGIFVYPNPNEGVFELKINREELIIEDLKISIYNVLGEKIYETIINYPSQIITIQLEQPAGAYYLQLIENNQVMTKKIIVK